METQINATDYKIIYVIEDEKKLLLENKETEELLKIPITDEVMQVFDLKYELQDESSNSENSPSLLSNLNYNKTWNDSATRHLINEFATHETLFQNNKIKNDSVWKMITESLNKSGYRFTNTQTINKWKHLRKQYIKEKDSMGPKSTGSEPISFKYYEEMDAIYCKKPNITPIAIASSSRGSQLNKEEVQVSFQSGTCKHKLTDDSDVPDRKKSKITSPIITWMESREEKRENLRQKRHEENIALQKEAQNVFCSVMDKLIDKL